MMAYVTTKSVSEVRIYCVEYTRKYANGETTARRFSPYLEDLVPWIDDADDLTNEELLEQPEVKVYRLEAV